MQSTKDKSGLDLKVLICQLNPKFKDVDYNTKRVDVSLSRYTAKDALDVIVLPEMAFTGYCFKDKEDIKPFLEEAGKGKTFEFCSTLAIKLNCYVMCGYAELFIDQDSKKEHMYNSAYVIDRKGELYFNYRKHYLYETDHLWAEEGPGFKTIKLTNTKGVEFKAAIAICMDINPYEFKDTNEFGLAEFCKKEEIDALFFLCAWLDNEPGNPGAGVIKGMINYWIYRLYLLMQDKSDPTRYQRKWAFFCANRIGKEGDTTFLGCSCALKCNPVELVGNLDRKNEGFLLAEITL